MIQLAHKIIKIHICSSEAFLQSGKDNNLLHNLYWLGLLIPVFYYIGNIGVGDKSDIPDLIKF